MTDDKLLHRLWQLGDWLVEHVNTHHNSIRSFAAKQRTKWLNAPDLEVAINAVERLAFMLNQRSVSVPKATGDAGQQRLNKIRYQIEVDNRPTENYDVEILWRINHTRRPKSQEEVLFYLWKYYKVTGLTPDIDLPMVGWVPTVKEVKKYFKYKDNVWRKVLARTKAKYVDVDFKEAVNWGIYYVRQHGDLPLRREMLTDFSMPDPRQFPLTYREWKQVVLEKYAGDV